MAHRYRLHPTDDQTEALRRHCSDARFVWNLALEQANHYQANRGHTPSNAQRMRQLADARKDSWLGEGSSIVQQAALRDFDRAMRSWWSGSHRRPTWRRRGVHEGFAIRDLTVRIVSRKWATVSAPKVGPVRFRLSRPIPEGTKSARVTLDRADRWHVSFGAIPAHVDGPGDGSVVGVDRGIVIDYQASDGRSWDVPALGSFEAARVRRLQRRLARQVKGSNRRARTKHQIARLRAREADRRKDAIEKATTSLAHTADFVVLEDLRVAQMMRSSAGTIDLPGVNVAQKRGLNRSIAQTGWAMFAQRLGHKIGDRLVLVPAAGTSLTCNSCGHRDRESRESQARFVCRSCGVVCNADLNAALNIAAAGRAVVGRGRDGAIRPPDEASTDLVGAA